MSSRHAALSEISEEAENRGAGKNGGPCMIAISGHRFNSQEMAIQGVSA
jgi:hypothetical protein